MKIKVNIEDNGKNRKWILIAIDLPSDVAEILLKCTGDVNKLREKIEKFLIQELSICLRTTND